jgi:hypothetical protein
MSLTSPSDAAAVALPAIDEQLRLRIAEQLAGWFKGEVIGPDHHGYEDARWCGIP